MTSCRCRRALSMILLATLVGSAADAGGETVNQAYKAALQSYYKGEYAQAVAGFKRVLSIPLNDPDLHYNLGCAYYRLDQSGYAIYHFERALQLDPAAEDAAFNLRTVREAVAKKITDELKGGLTAPLWVRAVRLLATRTWAVLFLVFWWLTFGVLFVLRFINPGPARAGLIAGNSFFALLALICGGMLAGRVYVDARVTHGIVLPKSLAVKEGPGTSTKTSFKLHAGLKVRVQQGDGGWVRIRLPNGLEGWVPHDKVGLL